MSELDRQTYKIFKEIKEHGYLQPNTNSKYADTLEPAKTIYLTNQRMIFMPDQIPFLESKKMAKKDPFRELSWFYIHKSNDVGLLRDELNCNVWNEWEEKDVYNKHFGTIGHAYGFIIGRKYRNYPMSMLKPEHLNIHTILDTMRTKENDIVKLDQLDYLIHELINNPFSRYHIISLWDVRELDEMKLKPCVWTINFQVLPDYTLEMTLTIRSNDMALGNPYNMLQYKQFQVALANVVNYKVGKMTVDIHNAHYYDRHIDITEEQFMSYDIENEDVNLDPTMTVNHHINFYEYTAEDFTINTQERIVRGAIWTPPKLKFPLSVS